MEPYTQGRLLQRIYEHFAATSHWPPVWRLAIELEKEFGPDFDLESICSELGPELVLCGNVGDPNAVCRLTLRGIDAAASSAPEIAWFLSAVRIFARQYRDRTGPTTEVSERSIQEELGLSDEEVRRVVRIVYHEPDLWSQAQTGDATPWTFRITPTVNQYRNVESLADYFARRDQLRDRERKRFSARSRPPGSFQEARTTPWRVSAVDQAVTIHLHQSVWNAARALFEDGHYADGARAAMQALEFEIQTLARDRFDSGTSLIGKALGGDTPLIRLNRGETRIEIDEQQGMHFLARGAMTAIRNPLSHGAPRVMDRDEAIECLAIASFLFRKLDTARAFQASLEDPPDAT